MKASSDTTKREEISARRKQFNVLLDPIVNSGLRQRHTVGGGRRGEQPLAVCTTLHTRVRKRVEVVGMSPKSAQFQPYHGESAKTTVVASVCGFKSQASQHRRAPTAGECAVQQEINQKDGVRCTAQNRTRGVGYCHQAGATTRDAETIHAASRRPLHSVRRTPLFGQPNRAPTKSSTLGPPHAP